MNALIVFAFTIFVILSQHNSNSSRNNADDGRPPERFHQPAPVPGWRIDWASTRLNYFGRVQPLLQSIAQSVGLTFRESGQARQKDVYVWVDTRGQSLEETLAIIAKQLNDEADIVIRNQEIELRWR